jgi:hypothetical protein
MRHSLAFLAVLVLMGCESTARIYPVEGPYTQISPLPVIEAKFTGLRNDGELEFTLPDGPICKGEWTSTPNSSVGLAVMGSTPGTMMAVGGHSPAGAVATCSDGRVMNFELSLSSVGKKRGTGIGKDTKGNVYRFML